MSSLFWTMLAAVLSQMGPPSGEASQDPRDKRFFDYWHQGEAEISRFRLSQARYGENHDGHAVLIFVTEDFLPGRGVKYEGSDPSGAGSVPVLKLNLVKKFTTGIYPYSMMCSVFTPTSGGTRTLKVSASIQEWCGHVYQQTNLRDGKYHVDLHSYFEKEADRAHELEAAMLEDEIWTRIRLGPAKLPLGQLRMIPGAFTTRFRHRPASVEKVEARLEDSGGSRSRYSLRYPELGRALTITFAKAFPHEILAWEEVDEFGGRKSVTRAERTHHMKIDYWTKNKKRYLRLRRELGL